MGQIPYSILAPHTWSILLWVTQCRMACLRSQKLSCFHYSAECLKQNFSGAHSYKDERSVVKWNCSREYFNKGTRPVNLLHNLLCTVFYWIIFQFSVPNLITLISIFYTATIALLNLLIRVSSQCDSLSVNKWHESSSPRKESNFSESRQKFYSRYLQQQCLWLLE